MLRLKLVGCVVPNLNDVIGFPRIFPRILHVVMSHSYPISNEAQMGGRNALGEDDVEFPCVSHSMPHAQTRIGSIPNPSADHQQTSCAGSFLVCTSAEGGGASREHLDSYLSGMSRRWMAICTMQLQVEPSLLRLLGPTGLRRRSPSTTRPRAQAHHHSSSQLMTHPPHSLRPRPVNQCPCQTCWQDAQFTSESSERVGWLPHTS